MFRSLAVISASPELERTLGRPGGVVAIESVAFAHGFDGDVGSDLASACMAAVRSVGSIPAFGYVADGRVVLESDADRVADFLGSGSIRKLGSRDLADAIHRRQPGALTIGGTLAVARMAAIRVVSTGGLGGVHLGFAKTLDISSDLQQVASSPAVLVSAGIKPVLDVRASAEALETLGVPTLGWRSDEIPTFYRRGGGPRVSSRVETVGEAAAMAVAHWALGLGGLLLLRPPDSELDIEEALAMGLADAEHAGVEGAEVTPFLLRRLDEETGARTIVPHMELLIGNARLAGEVATALSLAAFT